MVSAKYSGDCWTMMSPFCCIVSRTSGAFIASLIVRLSRAVTSFGTPAGATKPNQPLAS
jgi:hypothetical protein